jgi:DNA-binding CsgD family transcriptional regulator
VNVLFSVPPVDIILRQFKDILSLINELHMLPDDLSRRRDRLLDACGWIFKSSLAMLAIVGESESGCSVRALGVSGDRNQLRQEQITALFGVDCGILARLRATSHHINAATWHQLQNDPSWRESDRMRLVLGASLTGDGLWCTYEPAEQPAEFVAIALFRADADAMPFTARDARLLETLVEGLQWMFEPSFQLRPVLDGMNRGNVLAPRLQRLLDCLMMGKTEKQAARELRLTRNTVHTYVRELYRVLEVTSRGELFAKAYLRVKSDAAEPMAAEGARQAEMPVASR